MAKHRAGDNLKGNGMSEITLAVANRNYSSWSMRAGIALRMTGLLFDEVVVPLRTPETATEIAKHSPSGLLPALRHGDRTMWDSLAIGEYLAEVVPDAGLWPADAAARAAARSVVAEMHSGFRALRSNMSMNIRERRPGAGRTPEVAADIARITAMWRDCRARFGEGGPFLFGVASLADAFYAPVASRFATYVVDLDPVSQAYVETVLAWPPVADWCEGARAEPWVIADF